jgi:SAM-dependent methyltransferase
MPSTTSTTAPRSPEEKSAGDHSRRAGASPLGQLKWMLAIGGGLMLITALIVHQFIQYSSQMNLVAAPLPYVPRNAPFIKTPDRIVDQMIELAQVVESDLVYDLGCGDGRLVIGTAVNCGCRGIGFDIDPERIAEANANAQRQGVEGLVSFHEQDIFQVDLAQADVVLAYLLPWMMDKLTEQFQDCKPGARIVSHDFPIDGYEFDEVVELTGEQNELHHLYLYITPLKKSP